MKFGLLAAPPPLTLAAGLKGSARGVMLYLESREGPHCRREGDFPDGRVLVAAASCGGNISGFVHAYRTDIRHVFQGGQELPRGGIGIDFRGDVEILQKEKNEQRCQGSECQCQKYVS